jgi:hypothetical protein
MTIERMASAADEKNADFFNIVVLFWNRLPSAYGP